MLQRVITIYRLLDGATRRRLPLSLILGLVISLTEAVGVGMIFPVMMAVADPPSVNAGGWLGKVYAWTGAGSLEVLLGIIGGAMVTLLILKNVLAVIVTRWQVGFLAAEESAMSKRFYAHYLSMPYIECTRRNSSELIQKVIGEVPTAIAGFLMPAIGLSVECAVIAGLVSVVVLIDWAAALCIMLMLFAAGSVFHYSMRSWLARIGERLISGNTMVLKKLREGIGAAKEIRVLDRTENLRREFSVERDKLAKLRATQTFLGALPRYYLEIVLLLALVVVAFVTLGRRSLPEAVSLMALIGAAGLRLLPSVNRVLSLLQQMSLAAPSVDQVAGEFLKIGWSSGLSLPIGRTRSAKMQNAQLGVMVATGIMVRDLHFKYPERTDPVLKGVNLNLAWGQSLGVVGASGVGKSTLLDIVLGLYSPDRGQVLVDGRDIADDLAAWRRRVGYVPQDISLVDDTIRRNIALGIPAEEIDGGRIKRVIAMARLDELVRILPEGLETVVGEEGVRLSGGQRQRIGIARALYHDPDVIIFDEATSSLDNETERQISETINDLAGEKTLIIIAHRLNTVRQCGTIAVIKDGVCSAQGSFDELARNSGDFISMVRADRTIAASAASSSS